MSSVRKESLGRMAVFLLPSHKLKVTSPRHKETIEERVKRFLLEEYNGFTASSTINTGWWTAKNGDHHYDEHREYKVSFPGKERIAKLDEFLAEIARDMGEECIYIETGEDAWLVYA